MNVLDFNNCSNFKRENNNKLFVGYTYWNKIFIVHSNYFTSSTFWGFFHTEYSENTIHLKTDS